MKERLGTFLATLEEVSRKLEVHNFWMAVILGVLVAASIIVWCLMLNA